MSVLVVAAHDGKTVRANVANAVAAATQIGGDVHVLVAGSNAGDAAKSAAAIAGVAKVLQAEDAAYANWVAEDIAPLIVKLAPGYGHVVMAADTVGKNVMPRVAALLDVAQVSEAIQIVSPDTFVRPIYAGNAMATVQSTDKIKVVTVRPTNFTAAAGGGSAAIEQIGGAGSAGLSSYVGAEIS
ncbi:MAG: electron transfer flavoprotein subunit alpha/FixB family protein, partial [Reyranellaceae bacterium]